MVAARHTAAAVGLAHAVQRSRYRAAAQRGTAVHQVQLVQRDVDVQHSALPRGSPRRHQPRAMPAREGFFKH